jgi:PST family polysaccharide transporter
LEGAFGDIGRKLLGGLGWNAAGLIVQMLAQLAITIVLARLLGPTPFGLAAMAWAVIAPMGVLVDAGLGQSLVQKPDVRDDEIAFCFWAQLSAGIVLAVVFCLLSPAIAALFAEPTLQPVLLAFSGVLVLQGLSGTSLSLLRRDLRFRGLQLVQVSSLISANLLIAVPLALLGAGVWSLVASAIGVAALQAAIGYFLTRHSVRLRLGRGHERLLAISPKFLLLSLVNVAGFAMIPRLIIGRAFGVDALGLFDRAHALIVMPLSRLAAMVDSVLFASHARLLERRAATHGELYVTSLTVALLFALPAAAVIIPNGSAIIEVLLGKQWTAAAAFVPPLALLIPVFFVVQVSVPVLSGLGRPGIELVVQIIVLLLFGSLVAVVPRNAVEVIWMLAGAHALRAVCLTACVAKITGIAPGRLLAAAAPGAVVLGLVLSFNYFGRAVLPASLSPTAALATLLVGSALIAAAISAIWFKYFLNDGVRRAFAS